MEKRFSKYIILLIALFIIIVSIALQLYKISGQSPTIDEPKYLYAGEDVVKNLRWDSVYERLHPPLMYYLAGGILSFFPHEESMIKIFWSRVPFIFLTGIFGLFIFLTARFAYGYSAGFLALILFAFNPEILAHGRIISADLIGSFGIFLATLAFIKFLKGPTQRSTVLLALALGFALLTKYTTLILLPIFFSYSVIFYLRKRQFQLRPLGLLILSFMGAIFLLNVSYLFHETTVLPTSFETGILQRFLDTPILKIALYALPKPFLTGFDLQLSISQKGWWGWFWGKEYIQSPWYVLPGAFLIKTPLPLLLMLIISIILTLKKKLTTRPIFESVFIYLITTVIFYMSFVNNVAIGLRYLLPIYPFLFIFASRLATFKPSNKTDKYFFNTVSILLISWYVIKTVAIAPHFLAFTNEAFGGPQNAYKYFVDSNLDWGQNAFLLEEYRQINSDVIIEPKGPTSGRIIVGVNQFNLWERGRYEWLHKLREKPIDSLGYTWLIFDITEQDIRGTSTSQ